MRADASSTSPTPWPQRRRRCPSTAFLAALCASATTLPAAAATFQVNATVDAVDVSPGNGVCATAAAKCTLRAAIQEANALPGLDTVKVPAGVYRLTLLGKGEALGATGDLNIRRSMRLEGAGPYSTFIQGTVCADPDDPGCTSEDVTNDTDRVLSVLNAGTNPVVDISGLTIQNGGGYNVVAGGLYVGDGTTVTLARVRVRENKSRQFGGGIANDGDLTVFQSAILRNTLPLNAIGGVTSSGGGILNSVGGTLRVDRSLVAENEAARGGGIRNAGGTMVVVNSTISGNQAVARGGGVMNFGQAAFAFATITANEANWGQPEINLDEERRGGGIYQIAGEGSTLLLGNSILAGNTDHRSAGDAGFAPDCYGTGPGAFSLRGNVVGIWNPSCPLKDAILAGLPLDRVGTSSVPRDPKLASLADNGGPTRTHAALAGSPARDFGTSTLGGALYACPAYDQRTFVRPRDGNGDGLARCDSGAFETNSMPGAVTGGP